MELSQPLPAPPGPRPLCIVEVRVKEGSAASFDAIRVAAEGAIRAQYARGLPRCPGPLRLDLAGPQGQLLRAHAECVDLTEAHDGGEGPGGAALALSDVELQVLVYQLSTEEPVRARSAMSPCRHSLKDF